MADSDLIKVGTSVDTSGLKSGMAEASSITAAQLAILKEQYKVSSTEIRESVNRIVDAEKQAAEAISLGHQKVAAVLQATANAERTALDGLIAKQLEYKTAIDAPAQAAREAAQAEKEAAAAAAALAKEEAAAAAAAEELAAAQGHTVTAVQAASSEIRLFEGALPIRAVERFAVTTLGLGPAMQAIFPYVGAVAFGEILSNIIEKVKEWWDGLKRIEDLNETIGKQQADDLALQKRYGEQVKENELKLKGILEGPASEQGARQGILSKAIEQDKQGIADLQGALANVHRQLENERAQVVTITDQATAEKYGRNYSGYPVTENVSAEFQQDKDEKSKVGLMADLDAQNAKLLADQSAYNLAKGQMDKDATREAKQAATEAKAVFRQAEEDQRNADTEALADLRSTHLVTVSEELTFWKARLTAESQYSDRVREIRREIGTLTQEQDRATARAAAETARQYAQLGKQIAEEEAKIPEETKRNVDEDVKTWEEGGKRTLQQEIDKWAEIRARYSEFPEMSALVREAIDKETEATKRLRDEQARAAEAKVRGQGEAAVGGLQGQRQQVERAGVTSPDQSVQAKINTQRELAAIDAQIIAEQKATNDQLAALKLAAAGGDTSNAAYQAQLQANIKAEQLANQKIYADQTKILQETQQQYTTFFNSIEQGWAKAITNMLTEHKKFSTEVVSIEKQLTASFTQMVLKRVTTWIEGTALIQAAERSFNLILQALHLEQFTQTATQTAALATIQNNALAESVAAQKAADEADVISSAGAGAAAAAAEAAPLGPEAAAAAGIAVGSEILALGQFEIGGIVPGRGPVPVMAHGGEKIIDSKLTQMLVNVAQGGGGGGGFTNHGGINVYGSSGNGREQGGDIMRSIDSHVRRSNLRMA